MSARISASSSWHPATSVAPVKKHLTSCQGTLDVTALSCALSTLGLWQKALSHVITAARLLQESSPTLQKAFAMASWALSDSAACMSSKECTDRLENAKQWPMNKPSIPAAICICNSMYACWQARQHTDPDMGRHAIRQRHCFRCFCLRLSHVLLLFFDRQRPLVWYSVTGISPAKCTHQAVTSDKRTLLLRWLLGKIVKQSLHRPHKI